MEKIRISPASPGLVRQHEYNAIGFEGVNYPRKGWGQVRDGSNLFFQNVDTPRDAIARYLQLMKSFVMKPMAASLRV
jgi:hypothetical protein